MINLVRRFENFYRGHSTLIGKYGVSLKNLLQQSIAYPEFYGDLVYRIKNVGTLTFWNNSESQLTVIKE